MIEDRYYKSVLMELFRLLNTPTLLFGSCKNVEFSLSYNGFTFGTSIWLGFGREKALMPPSSTKIKFFKKKTVPHISFLLL
jgi:hypothetical protein